MLDRDTLDALLDLHRRSYALLRWMSERMKAGTLRMDALHGALDEARAAEAWLRRNLATLPAEARPPEARLETFAHLFASYLVTSFEVKREWVRRAPCGCRFCAIVVNAPRLRARAPSALDVRVATELAIDCLEVLAAEEALALFREELAPLAADPDLSRPLAMITWVRELGRRAEYRGQGRPVLALWRAFAWEGRRPIRALDVTAELVLQAEATVRARVRGAGG